MCVLFPVYPCDNSPYYPVKPEVYLQTRCYCACGSRIAAIPSTIGSFKLCPLNHRRFCTQTKRLRSGCRRRWTRRVCCWPSTTGGWRPSWRTGASWHGCSSSTPRTRRMCSWRRKRSWRWVPVTGAGETISSPNAHPRFSGLLLSLRVPVLSLHDSHCYRYVIPGLAFTFNSRCYLLVLGYLSSSCLYTWSKTG